MKTFPISESLFLNRGLWYLGMALSVVVLLIATFEYWKNRKDKRPNLS